MKVMLDLCSGFGGASQAFEESDAWHVIRIENNPEVIAHPSTPKTQEIDVMSSKIWRPVYDIGLDNHIELIWASPPCYDYTLAYNGPRAIHHRCQGDDSGPYEPSTAIVKRIVEIIQRLAPTYWVIENVKGSQRFLEPILGPPTMIKGPWVLWGDFPLFDFEFDSKHKGKIGDRARHSPLRSNHRAKIPQELSEGLFQAITYQKILGDY